MKTVPSIESAYVELYARLSGVAALETPQARIEAIARDLAACGWGVVEIVVLGEGFETAHAAAGSRQLFLETSAAGWQRRFEVVQNFERDGIAELSREEFADLAGQSQPAGAFVFPLRAGKRVLGLVALSGGPVGAPPGESRLLRTYVDLVAAMLESDRRMAELAAQSSAANRALAESNEFKDDLLAMFTHDFRGPLTVILGYGELLLESPAEDATELVTTILAQTTRLAKLADDALALAQTQTAGFSMDRIQCDLVPFVRETVEELDRNSGRVKLNVKSTPILLSIDRTRLRHVLDNVIGNALKYSQGDVEVHLDQHGSEASIRVRDSGIGIPRDEIERVFARFGRASNARRKGIAGSGVGLYVSRKIVDVHGGSIRVESEEGQGSTFCISLPLSAVPERRSRERDNGPPISV